MKSYKYYYNPCHSIDDYNECTKSANPWDQLLAQN